MKQRITSIGITLLLPVMMFAQHPLQHFADAVEMRFDNKQPIIHYTLRVDTNDLAAVHVTMNIRNVPDTFHVAMVAHPEYDDKYWRYVNHFTDAGSLTKIEREDSALWRVIAAGGQVTLHYSVSLPASQGRRAAWRPYLSSGGGLIGGPHMLMYIIGATLAPSHITLELPGNWEVVTGLTATADPHTFFAASVSTLIDGPFLVGFFKKWHFSVDGIPHTIAYWPLSKSAVFDSTRLIDGTKKIVEQASALFGRLPYREYFFILQDSSFGSLEHANSVTLGVPADELVNDFKSYLDETAHEYTHAWNLMRIHPAEYADVSYKTPAYSRGLWWSEGLTMFYADLFLRRAHLPISDTTRIQHLERLIRRYLGTAGNNKISAEKVSLAEYAPAGTLGDYLASSHLQGELIGNIFDIIIRNATNGKRSIDDLMRAMMERFSGRKGFTGQDIERLVQTIAGVNMHSFFDDHIRGNKMIDINSYLRLMGLRAEVTWKDVVDTAGKPLGDSRIYSWQDENSKTRKIGLFDPSGCWGKAGLHTGDELIAIDNKAINNDQDFRLATRGKKIGDTVLVDVHRTTGIYHAKVIISGYQQPVVHIYDLAGATQKQVSLRRQWMNEELGN